MDIDAKIRAFEERNFGRIEIDDAGKCRFARLYFRGHMVEERIPLHFFKLEGDWKGAEAKRIVGELSKKMTAVCGAAPEGIL